MPWPSFRLAPSCKQIHEWVRGFKEVNVWTRPTISNHRNLTPMKNLLVALEGPALAGAPSVWAAECRIAYKRARAPRS